MLLCVESEIKLAGDGIYRVGCCYWMWLWDGLLGTSIAVMALEFWFRERECGKACLLYRTLSSSIMLSIMCSSSTNVELQRDDGREVAVSLLRAHMGLHVPVF